MEFSYVVIGLIVIGLVYFVVKEEKEKSSSTPSTPAPTKPVVNADANNNGITSKGELKKLTKNQLIEFADKKNLKVKKSGTKVCCNQRNSQSVEISTNKT